jgi:hypothetical protein
MNSPQGCKAVKAQRYKNIDSVFALRISSGNKYSPAVSKSLEAQIKGKTGRRLQPAI